MKDVFSNWIDKQKKLSTWVKRGFSLLVLFLLHHFNVEGKSIIDFCLTNKAMIWHYFVLTTIVLTGILFIFLLVVFIVAYFTIGMDGIEDKLDSGEGLIVKLVLYIIKKTSLF